MRATWLRLLVLCLATQAVQAAQPKPIEVRHAPERPRSGETVRISATGSALAGPLAPALQYQVVEPGRYIELADREFARNWVSVPMTPERSDANAAPSNIVFAVELPASLQKHRRLVRYRVALGDRVVAPAATDTQPNFAYFAHDGVPAWRAAISPQSQDAALSQTVTFNPTVLGSVQVYHFIGKKSSIENTTWRRPTSRQDYEESHRYNYTGTLVVEGQAYDHVRYRARGGSWRHAMGKNMWKFDFPGGHHLRAHDDFGQPYQATWEKLNLGACIQQGDYRCRGEHGLFEALTYRLFNLAGVPAPRTHYVHLRIIDEPEESPHSQYGGDFWGLYLATEEIDGNFLKEHDLPDGNIFKLDFEPRPEHFAKGAPTNRQDVLAFEAGYQRSPSENWWRQNVDLSRYFSYRSILECVHHYDIDAGKNYFYYHDPLARRWVVLPWDVDLSWQDTMFGGGREPFVNAGVLRHPALKTAYQNRLREIRDLLYNPEQTDALIDQYAAVIWDPAGGPSLVDADRMKWDYHPIMTSRYVLRGKADPGQFYLRSRTRDFRGMVGLMKAYVRSRGSWCDRTLLSDASVPPTPRVTAAGSLNAGERPPAFAASVEGPSAAGLTLEWRLAEVTLGPVTKPPRPRKYEIEALWQQTGPVTMEIPRKLFERDHTYRVRARARDRSGRCGHWSAPVQFTWEPAAPANTAH